MLITETKNNNRKEQRYNMSMNSKYKFVTVVATPEVREAFTALREELNTTDKELMSAFWNIGNANLEAVSAEVARLKNEKDAERAERKELKVAAKLKEKELKPKAKRGRKKKELVENVVVSDDEDDVQCVVVDGTK